MNNSLSPLMEKGKTKKRKKIKNISFMISIFLLVAFLVGFYIAIEVFDMPIFEDSDLFSNNALAEYSDSGGAISTLVPTDYMALLADEEEVTEEVTPEGPTATPYVTAEPVVNPGDRDDMFTDGEIITGSMSYHSEDLSIEIEKVEQDGCIIYVAEVYIASLDNFLPVFANGSYDNGYQTVSDMADDYSAIFAINSDSCTAVDYGIIIRNGEVYRDIAAADHLAVFPDGSFTSFKPVNISADEFLEDDVVHVFNFGPLLLNDGEAIEAFTYSHIRSSNPRTAVGMVEPYHYFFVVADGRSDESDGMTLEELSAFMADLGCVDAYNLDGGGSSTMVFMGEVLNDPSGGEERLVDSAILLVEAD